MSPATRSKLLNVLSDQQQLLLLKADLAAVIDIGSYFIKATYNLQGDGVLVLKCYEELVKIRAAIRASYYPNLQAVARNSQPINQVAQQQLLEYAVSCVQPGFLYFQEKLGDDIDILWLFSKLQGCSVLPTQRDSTCSSQR